MLPEGIGVGLPELIPGLSDVVSVVAQAVSSAALKRDGTVWVWGSNEQAAFGNGQRDGDQITYTPVRVPGVQGVQALSGGVLGRHFLALLKIGSVQSWGNSDWGQAGSGISGEEQAKPALAKITGVKTVLGAGNNSYAVKTDGTLWIWGLGLPREWPLSANARIPVQLQLPDTK
jgi:alpha-tubulin suppressor-like RCC1 family protein